MITRPAGGAERIPGRFGKPARRLHIHRHHGVDVLVLGSITLLGIMMPALATSARSARRTSEGAAASTQRASPLCPRRRRRE